MRLLNEEGEKESDQLEIENSEEMKQRENIKMSSSELRKNEDRDIRLFRKT